MGNGMGGLYVAASALQNNQTALNTTANNLTNVGTKGYVRQQVLFEDRNYSTINTTTAIGYQQVGLGVSIADVVHSRDIFLDKYLRSESGRQAFYQVCADTTDEIDTYFQELEGETFQAALIGKSDGTGADTDKSLWVAIEELAKYPSNEVKQNQVIQKAALVLERAQAIYKQTQDYQQRLNKKVSDEIDDINSIGRKLREYNNQIQSVEAGGVETAMTLRDERDLLLDRLSVLVKTEYTEDADGVVSVKIEGGEFVDSANVYELGKKQDNITGFITPYWKQLSNEARNDYAYLFNYSTDIATELNTDVGELKALVLTRGDRWGDYRDVENMSQNQYNNSTYDHIATGMSTILSVQASLDQLMHSVMTQINDVFCPNTTAQKAMEAQGEPQNADGSYKLIGTDGQDYSNCMVWDEANAAVGSDGTPHELFSRIGEERYKKVTSQATGKVYYVYNEEKSYAAGTARYESEENWNDKTGMYSINNCYIKDDILKNGSLIPFQKTGDQGYNLGKELAKVFTAETLVLNPNATTPSSVKNYYTAMIGAISIDGNIYKSVASDLKNTVSSIENRRQSVIGVSSDEELTNMIRYQNAFNAASRYMNVVSEMLQHLVEKLGS